MKQSINPNQQPLLGLVPFKLGWRLIVTSTERALFGETFSSSCSHLLARAISALDVKSPTLCNRFMVGWVAVIADGGYGTAQDGTGTAWARTAGGATERGVCASEACISKSDLSCGCLWWCPHGRALRYGTWLLSGLSVWPFLFAGFLRCWPAVPTSSPRDPNPRPGSPPGTAHPPFPSRTGPGASEIHS